MADSRNTTSPDEAETVATLHARWRSRLDKLDAYPGLPTANRERRLDELQALEGRIAKTAAVTVGEIILKLRMIESGKVTGTSEGQILSGAIRDLCALDRHMPILAH